MTDRKITADAAICHSCKRRSATSVDDELRNDVCHVAWEIEMGDELSRASAIEDCMQAQLTQSQREIEELRKERDDWKVRAQRLDAVGDPVIAERMRADRAEAERDAAIKRAEKAERHVQHEIERRKSDAEIADKTLDAAIERAEQHRVGLLAVHSQLATMTRRANTLQKLVDWCEQTHECSRSQEEEPCGKCGNCERAQAVERAEKAEAALEEARHQRDLVAEDANKQAAACAEMRAETERLRDAIRWALGEGDDFSVRDPSQGCFWWRKELRARAALAETNKDPCYCAETSARNCPRHQNVHEEPKP